MKPTCVLVIGLPRSGTSMTAGVLHKLGVSMTPYDSFPKSEHNPAGYFEDEAFVEFHCQAIGTHKSDFLFTDHDRQYVFDEVTIKIYWALIKDREDQFPYWGIKDPRMLHFTAYFLSLCSSHLKVIEIFRDQQSVLRSWRRVMASGGFKKSDEALETYYYQWQGLRENAMRLYYLAGAQIMKLNYEAVLGKPEAAVEQLANFVGLPPTQAAIDFIDPSLNHGSKGVAVNDFIGG